MIKLVMDTLSDSLLALNQLAIAASSEFTRSIDSTFMSSNFNLIKYSFYAVILN